MPTNCIYDILISLAWLAGLVVVWGIYAEVVGWLWRK